jgi:exopolysaccharide production protein ExoQ
MPPHLAFFLTIGFVGFLFRRDILERPDITRALWLPLIWTLFVGSRSPVQWLSALGVHVGGSSTEEGNPIDAFVYLTLTAAAFFVLNKRRATFAEIFRNNPWFVVFIFYALLSIVWSDFPFVAFKRWIKTLGHPAMALVLLTEPDFEESLTRLMKRSAYVLIPFSILLIKYFEDIGRYWDEFTGVGHFSGVNLNKNGLGGGCMVFGTFFLWHLLKTWKGERSKARRNELLLIGGFMFMIAYLLRKAHCATCFLCLLIAIAIIILLGRKWVDKRLIVGYALVIVFVLGVAELGFGVFEHVVDLTGHESTIAGRAELWHDLLEVPINPILGVGFESFWMGDRLQAMWATHWWQPTQAHNGYLETYLNLGVVGLCLLIGLIGSTFQKARLELFRNFDWGRYRLGMLVAILFHNWTEASFRGLGLSWFVFHIIALDYPNFRFAAEPPSEVVAPEDEVESAYFSNRI